MHQRHNIRHSIHQAPMMRPPHIPSQMNVSIAPHPQQVNIQQPPPQLTTQQPPTQQAQPHTQHTNIPIGTGPQIMPQYIPTPHQRGDPNRLGHHLPPPASQQQQQQSQPQPQQQQPSQLTLQQPPLSQPPQRISPQMHQPHYMKSRPPNINNSNIGGVNVNQLQQQHPQLQPPPPPAATNLSNHPLPHQSHHQQIPPPHQQQQQQHQLQQIPIQQHNNNNNYNQKQNHTNKIVNHPTHKYNANTTAGVGHSKINQVKHSQQHLQSPLQPHHQQQPQLQQSHQPQIISNVVKTQPTQQAQSQTQPPSQQHANQPQHINQCNSQQTVQVINQTQISQHKIIQNSNKVLNSQTLVSSATTSTCSTVNATQNLSNNSPSLLNSTTSNNSQSQINQNIPIVNLSTKSKTSKNSSSNVNQNVEHVQNQKVSKKQNSVNAVEESPENIEHPENTVSQPISNEPVSVPSTENISSGKEKTPMCLVNELARYNQIQHQYRLTGEQGPAHSKRFTVILNLGDEEYTAEGLSIKKAQHTAAAEAITKTKYEHPPPKKVRHKNGSSRFGIGNITPTVELNALAMKLGERAVYVFDSSGTAQTCGTVNQIQSMPPVNQQSVPTALAINSTQQIISNGTQTSMSPVTLTNGPQPPPPPPPSLPHMPNYYCESNYQYGQFNSRNNLVNIYLNGNGMRFPNVTRRPYARGGYMKFRNRMMAPLNGIHPNYNRDACKITLLVGKEKFTGVGPTVQAAKHDAASRALEVLKPIAEASEDVENLNTSSGESGTEIKSPISLVYEIGLKRNLLVTFEVKSEVGPPHLKNFITICKVGDITTEGEGNGKKISKKRAAKKMLEELNKLPPVSPEKPPPANTYQNSNKTSKGSRAHKRNSAAGASQQGATQQTAPKKRIKNVIKEKPEPENPEEMNPISRLIQIQQALKEREPAYTVVEEKGAARRREFTIEVTANGQSARGSGSNKKIAKRNAAKNLLVILGYEPNQNNKENNSNVVNTADNNSNKIKTSENDLSRSNSTSNAKTTPQAQSGSSSRQIVPGLIHLPKNSETHHNTNSVNTTKQSQQNSGENEPSQKASTNDEVSNKSESVEKPKGSERKSTEFGVRPKDQLLYLAQILDFEANFTDYPKGNHGEFLTIIALFTDPPQLCHGAGENSDASQDNAALAALEMLSKLGLDNVKPKKIQSSNNNISDEKKPNSKKEGENN
ncbi:maternal effect protein staufen [Condylostylus longicornis]|uniref:maternal effect protein staufen n=1 Tax=Condylostylus longicornis TaxID=2530218 RepID=UPI00244E2094|nr:maternal effect protein staufen [Condylostylus longicornis]XP_055379367.1 maternal effect protein staufen [Condylostylus longicornis]